MPRAGFYAIASSRITFGRDGRWYSDGEPIVNQRIAELFSRHITRHPDGGYQIVMGDERARIEVDDTPFVVISVGGNRDEGFTIRLNDGSEESLAAATLRVGDDQSLSCTVKNGSERARFLRAAHHQLSPFIDEVAPGRYALRCRGSEHPIAHV
ncbi:MAG: DUF1285 domain-containing protein [Deltaproteobacteria bacterium]|nr:DUF1285 domain-containing protein [Deltaproteobacteria bacterium]MBI3388823.1 DUF1285 domain-containing protein [Deltaproteobacteria bacterium]